jgi:hypothetical protein
MTDYAPGPENPEIVNLKETHLVRLHFDWGPAYKIWYQAGQYCAMRRDNGAICRDGDPEALREALREDYAARPVPR